MTDLSSSSLLDLTGKVALVTGAARGIGRAIALRLAEAGAAVVVADRLAEDSAQTVGLIHAAGGKAVAAVGDLSHAQGIEDAVRSCLDNFASIDILVNNAALRGWSTWDTLTEQEWDRFMAVNSKSVFFLSQAVGRQMVQQATGGSIINIASTAAAQPVAWKVDYNMAKAGVAMMTRSLARELGSHMIRVNAVGPGGTQSPGGAESITLPGKISVQDLQKMGQDWQARMAMPIGLLDPDEIARGVLFFASDMARSITGQVLFIDGGYLVG
ncbi:SDR family NAD(P)-dependent oxidoreductase [Pseudomonas sp. GB2N2]